MGVEVTMLFESLLVVMGILVSVLAWIGSRVHTKIDSLTERIEEKLDDVNHTLRNIEKDIRQDLVEHEKRITALEVDHDIRLRVKQNANKFPSN